MRTTVILNWRTARGFPLTLSGAFQNDKHVSIQDLYSKTYILKNRPSLTVNRKNIYIKKQVLSQLFRTKASNSQDKTPQHSCDTDPLMQLVTLHFPFGLFP